MRLVRSVLAVSAATLLLSASAGGCSSEKDEPETLSRDELLDPTTCGRCHEDHYREWSGSMHAYAGEDPVFIAFNKRLQRETNGALGDFCIKCHAPMAVKDGLSKDGLNIGELPAKYRGVTCFFCHTVESVGQLHNNGLGLGDPLTMRGSFADPVGNRAHRSTRSDLFDERQLVSSDACGSCHDIITPGGAHIERTLHEWKQSLFATETGQTCGSCHMKPSAGLQPIANVPGVFARSLHSHTFAAVDRALTPFPNLEEQKSEVQDFLDATIQAALCVTRRGESAQIRVILDNVFAGHSFPSGSSSDRRVWVELIAKKQDQVVYQSGVVEDGKAIEEVPDLWMMRDHVFDATGAETHLFGKATCYESRILPFPVTANPTDPRFYQRNIVRDFPADGTFFTAPETVSLRVRILPVGYDVLDDLIATGDLDPSIRTKMEAMQVGPTVTWTPGVSQPFVESGTGTAYECVTKTNQNYQANKFPPPVTNTCGR